MDSIFHVYFPRLFLSVNINPVAFKLGDFPIYWYGLMLCIGFVLGFSYSSLKAKKLNLDQNKLTDVAFLSTLASALGARLYYIAFCADFSYYLKNPTKFFYFHEGGLAVYGGILSAVFVAFLVCKIKKISYPKFLDVASFGIFIGQAIGRWGNFFNQEAFGVETTSIFGMCSESTGEVAVHPCFLYESFWCFIGLILLEIILRRHYKFSGELFLIYVTWYGLGRFFIEGLRADSLLIPYTSFRISQVLSLFLILLGSLLLLVNTIKFRSVKQRL